MKIPSIQKFTETALANGYSFEEIEALENAIADKKEKLKEDLAELTKLEKLAKIVAKTRLEFSIDTENLQATDYAADAGIVTDDDVETTNEEKVML